MMKLRKILIFTMIFILIGVQFAGSYAADDKMTSEEAYSSTCWEPIHRWDFNGNLKDSVGGAVAKPAELDFFEDPSYSKGRIILDGYQAYYFDEALINERITIRVDIKCRFDMDSPMGLHSVFGENSDKKNAGVKFINLAGDEYEGYALALSTSHSNFKSFVLQPDLTKYDPAAENLYTFIAEGKTLYYYVNGVLVASTDSVSKGGKWIFNDFLGSSTQEIPCLENFVGEIDYIQIAKYNEAYNSESLANKLKANLNTIIILAAVVVVVVALAVVVIVVVKKKKAKMSK